MHIRAMGELHDTINAQAKEIEQLKADLLSSKKNSNNMRYRFKLYRESHKLLNPTTKSDKLRVHIIQAGLIGKTNKAKTLELAGKFFMSSDSVRVEWAILNRRGAAS